jgi:predicted nucleic acid-binding protein
MRALRLAAQRPLSTLDIMIAAVGRLHDATIVTRDTGDFEHCGVSLLNAWLSPNSR